MKARIVVTWTGDDNTSFDTAVSIENDTVYDVSVQASGSKKYYSFTPSSTRFYTFESTDRGNADPYVWIYNDSQVLLTSNDDGAGNRNFKATYHLELGKTYYIAAGCFGTGTGTYSMTVTDSTNLTDIGATVITTTTNGSASISSAQKKAYFKFTPTVSSYYTIASSNSTSDPYGWIYKESGQYITKNDDGSSGRDFTICTYLESGKTYYIVGGCYGTNTDTYTVSVAVTTPSAPSNLTISNVTGNSMNLSWNVPATHYATRWLIQMSVNNGEWSNFTTTTSTNYSVTGLTASCKYDFRVYGEAGGPAWSGTRSLSSSNTATATTLPAQPTNLTASDITGNSVHLTWNTASPHGADRWLIQYRTSGGTWTDYDTSTSKSCNVTGLSANTAYEFRVYGERYATETWPGEYSLVSNTATATTLSGNVTIQQMLNNIQGSRNIADNKKDACISAANELLNLEYEPAFVAGLLANICHEGNIGLFEGYYVGNDGGQTNGNEYLVVLSNYLYDTYGYTYEDEFHNKHIYEKNLTEVYDIFSYLHSLDWEYNGERIGAGIGCVGWTMWRAYELMNIYREVCNYRDYITEEETLQAEMIMMLREINGRYNWIYDQWLLNNNTNISPFETARNAAMIICDEYEQPSSYDQRYLRASLAELIYEDMIQ